MPAYTPPTGNDVNFQLVAYAPDTGSVVNFELGGTTPPSTIQNPIQMLV